MSKRESELVTSSPGPSGEEPASSNYWRAMSGFNYQKLVIDRQASGQQGYGQQETFLSAFVTSEQRRLGRPMDLLEFGCGFGRHAWYLSELPDIRYHGYDFSEEMVAPLRKVAPAALSPLGEHLFVGPDVVTTLGDHRFDLVFTVSVLIHNPPERVEALLQKMGSLLKPGGTLCLVENQLVPFGVYENSWHHGCWLHRYVDLIGGGWDVHIAHGQVATHDIYLLRKNGGSERRLFQVSGPEQAFDERRPVSETELDTLGLPKLRKWARDAEPFLKGDVAPLRDRLWDAEAVLQVERERVFQRQRLLSLADDLRAVRAATDPGEAPRQQAPPHASTQPSNIQCDDPFDTHWAHVDPHFERVLHVFSQEWHGIRAASGYLPGRKLAISAQRPLTRSERLLALNSIADARSRAVVVHSWSRNMSEVVRLAKRLDHSLRVFAVWHGSTSQFVSDEEIDAFSALLEMRHIGLLAGLAAVKPGLELLSELIHPRTLLNLAPRLGEAVPPRQGLAGAALIPVANDWPKNFYTNLYAAAGEPRLRTVYVTAQHRSLKRLVFPARVVPVPRPPRAELFSLTRGVDISLNATLSECQPMAALEALAHGVPCVTGPLSLGSLGEHPYQRLAQLAEVGSIPALRERIARLLDERQRDPTGMAEMLSDYELHLRREALDRYGEFLGL